MSSKSSSGDPYPSIAEEWTSIRWPEASPDKRRLLAERYRDLWGALDESSRAQLDPSQAEEVPSSEDAATGETNPSPLDLSSVDILTGPEFERVIGEAFKQKGYTVEYHGGPTEAGGDLVCWEGRPDRVHAVLVQVKRERCLTGTKAIGQILRKENWFRAKYPDASYEKWVITSSDFTRQARVEAEGGRITLINQEALRKWLSRSNTLDTESGTEFGRVTD